MSQTQWALGGNEEYMECTLAGGSVLDAVVEEPVVMVLEEGGGPWCWAAARKNPEPET